MSQCVSQLPQSSGEWWFLPIPVLRCCWASGAEPASMSDGDIGDDDDDDEMYCYFSFFFFFSWTKRSVLGVGKQRLFFNAPLALVQD